MPEMIRRHSRKRPVLQAPSRGDVGKAANYKRRHILLGSVLLTVILVISMASYGLTRLQPRQHFENLKPVGKPTPSVSPIQSAETQIPPRQGVVNILLIGSDQRPGENAGHSDSMVLVHANLNTHQYSLLSIPRDTRVHLPGSGYTKLTSVQYIQQIHRGSNQGIVDAVQSVSTLTGVPIDYYVETNYTGLEKIVDAIGGIEMDLPFSVTLTHPWHPQLAGKQFAKGKHFMDGQAVAEVVHERDSVPGTDYGRQQLQGQALIGLAKATLNPHNLLRLPVFYDSLPSFLVATNLSKWDMLSLALGARGDFHPEQQIHYYQLLGTSETLRDDILGSYNNQVVINPYVLQQTIQNHFQER